MIKLVNKESKITHILTASALLVTLIVFSGCSSNKDSTVRLEKRHYTKGFHLNLGLSKRSEVGRASLTSHTSIETRNLEVPTKLRRLKKVVETSDHEPPGKLNLNSKDLPTISNRIEWTNQIPIETKELIESKNPDTDGDEPKAPIATAGIVALILALINLIVLMWFPFLGVLLSILTIIFAFKALKVDHDTSRYLGGTSIAISVFTFCVSAFATLLVILGLQLYPGI